MFRIALGSWPYSLKFLFELDLEEICETLNCEKAGWGWSPKLCHQPRCWLDGMGPGSAETTRWGPNPRQRTRFCDLGWTMAACFSSPKCGLRYLLSCHCYHKNNVTWSWTASPTQKCWQNFRNFPGGAGGKEPDRQYGDIGDTDSIPGLGRSPGGGNGNLLLCSCLENPMDRGAWWTAVHWVAKRHDWSDLGRMHV